ncbi:DUF3850 domain-containing protein [Listeria monocytogenes]|nr:DUF3850 domain-containing protein [Listeria monocytogenes]
MQSGNIAKLEQPKPVEVKKPLFEHLESYHDFRVMPLLKVAKDFINSDFWDDYCDLKNDGEDWSLAIAKAMQNGYVVEEEPKTHSLKILPEYFDAIDHGVKTFEIRKNDRNFKVGDILILREYDEEHYTGPELKTKITYITDYAQQDGYVVLGIEIEVSE